ncbi:acyl-[ACP]--phospholipid O-acyltransferase [Pelobacter seleniigenes]|uniref:acyl-[ACP]--phospholipid O-acyltransferase n=1 Tax=Pelobacter seleniigenes TaxID=407188 RepID=UPI000A0693EF|nr:acyl-[ACP]--phospholipid O-acyltransferase [Pelobacter seleniigenes]
MTRKLTTSFNWLNATQFFGALNDNLLKLLIVFYLIAVKGPDSAAMVAATAGGLFVVPFLLFSAPAGALADRLSKRTIVVAMKGAECLIALLAVLAFAVGSATALYAVLFLMATQSALFGPSKYGIVPELIDREQLSRANSLLETLTYLAIILGTALAPLLVQLSSASYRTAALACILFAILGLICSWRIEATPAADAGRLVSPRILSEIKGSLLELKQDGYLLLAVLGSAYFLFLGAFAQINLIPFGMQVHGLTQEQSGYLFLVAALGIGAGSLLAGRLSGRNVEFGIVPLGALGLALSTGGLALLPASLPVHLLLILLLGLSAGLFLVPLQAFIQLRAPREKLGRILAAASFLSWCGVLLASLLSVILSGLCGLSAAQSFLVLGLLTLGLTLLSLWILPDFLLRFIVLLVMKLGYRLKISGDHNLPGEGPALLVSNHVSWIDALLLLATQQRRIRFIMHRDIYNLKLLQPLFRLMQVIPVAADDSRRQKVEFIKTARQALDDGYLVCIFAEGMITRSGMLLQFKSGLEAIVRGTDHPIVPVYIGGAWGSIFSYAHGKLLSKLPTSLPYPVRILFGTPLPTTSSAAEVQQAVAELAYQYFQGQKGQRKPLIEQFIDTARSNWWRPALSDSSGQQLTYGRSLTATLLLARRLEARLGAEQMVGLLLPPSVGGALANLAVPLLGKVPVNINYTASTQAVSSAYQQCGIRTLLTSKRFLDRFSELPLPEQVLYLEDLLLPATKPELARLLVQARCWPRRLLLRGSGQGMGQGGDELATVIFSSGSTGMPKGVMLSQHNILSNLEAIRMVAATSPQDNVCGALPFFHALGFTATLWLPLISGFSASYHVNPMEAPAITKLVRQHRSTLLLTTPTFLATYMRRASSEDFSSLRLVVTGAEKLKAQLADAFAEKYALRPLEGYGATELAPLITLSLPDIKRDDIHQPGNKIGSVGRPIPGVLLQVVDPASHEPVAQGEEGLILVKGPNLMNGYLNDSARTAAAIIDGWYVSGDIGRVDRDGFLFITDRLARFSKIGGEMVPHIRIEEALCQALQLSGNCLAVTAVADSRKGEKLVVLHTEEAGSREDLQRALAGCDLPNLWRPASDSFLPVAELPLLGSGKLDLKGLRQLAEEGLAAAGSRIQS